MDTGTIALGVENSSSDLSFPESLSCQNNEQWEIPIERDINLAADNSLEKMVYAAFDEHIELEGSSTKYDLTDSDRVFSTSEDDEVSDYAERNIINCNDENTIHELANTSHGKKRKYKKKEDLTRKRLRFPENWERNVTKKATNQGLEYTSSFTKKLVPARSMKRSCGPGCRFKCESKISEEERKTFFTDYWSIHEHSRKYDFILRYVSEKPNKKNADESTKRNFSRIYTINCKNKHVAVCKLMFLNTLSISKQIVDTAFKKVRNGEKSLTDNRGKSKISPRAVSEEKTASLIKHINMFPRMESHYIRKESSREYLEETLSLSKMYSMYNNWTKENNDQTASKHHYYDTFYTKFNIGFFKPKKDQCDQCEGYKNASENEKKQLETKYRSHIENKEKSRKIKEADKILAIQNKHINMICFDFQKILSTPKSDASVLYYKRKLSVYNFTIYDIVHHKAVCYVWSENDAKRGSNEVASCLLHHIEKNTSEDISDFIFWSDNCAGQNRNKHLFSMYLYASCKYNVNIRHSFLEVGHTQNEGDSVHATIERHSKGRKIYTLNEWSDIIRSAKQAKPHYEVVNVTYDMIYDFKDLSAKLHWSKTVIKNNKKASTTLAISKLKQVQALKNSRNQLQYKTFLVMKIIKSMLQGKKRVM